MNEMMRWKVIKWIIQWKNKKLSTINHHHQSSNLIWWYLFGVTYDSPSITEVDSFPNTIWPVFMMRDGMVDEITKTNQPFTINQISQIKNLLVLRKLKHLSHCNDMLRTIHYFEKRKRWDWRWFLFILSAIIFFSIINQIKLNLRWGGKASNLINILKRRSKRQIYEKNSSIHYHLLSFTIFHHLPSSFSFSLFFLNYQIV